MFTDAAEYYFLSFSYTDFKYYIKKKKERNFQLIFLIYLNLNGDFAN